LADCDASTSDVVVWGAVLFSLARDEAANHHAVACSTRQIITRYAARIDSMGLLSGQRRWSLSMNPSLDGPGKTGS